MRMEGQVEQLQKFESGLSELERKVGELGVQNGQITQRQEGFGDQISRLESGIQEKVSSEEFVMKVVEMHSKQEQLQNQLRTFEAETLNSFDALAELLPLKQESGSITKALADLVQQKVEMQLITPMKLDLKTQLQKVVDNCVSTKEF